MLYPSPPRLAASVVVATILLVIFAHSLQLLVFVCFIVAATPHLLEAATSYHILSYKAIS